MTPADLCRRVMDAGMTIDADGAELVLKPAAKLTPDLRALLVQHKPELLGFIHQADTLTAELLARAMAVCDHHGDDARARADMRADIEATPAHLRADLLAHFQNTNPKDSA